MRPLALIDLHCDTLTAKGEDTLDSAQNALSLSNLPKEVCWGQCFAIFIPDDLRGGEAEAYFQRHLESFRRQMRKFSDRVVFCRSGEDLDRAFLQQKAAAFLTVENASALAGDLQRVGVLARAGVCAATLTWNGENELGSGHQTGRGLTEFGRQALREMEHAGILADVSHLNDTGFWQVMELAARPVLATHSNARAVAKHRRNLTDSMIRALVRQGGLMGLTYYPEFLQAGGRALGLDAPYRHVAHFFELGAEKNLALGSDFDGGTLPPCLDSPEKATDFFEYLLARGVPQSLAEGIFFQNARSFFRRNLPCPAFPREEETGLR